eukprot:scaffold12489_cov145-Isochrysis_galbana.AAC.2
MEIDMNGSRAEEGCLSTRSPLARAPQLYNKTDPLDRSQGLICLMLVEESTTFMRCAVPCPRAKATPRHTRCRGCAPRLYRRSTCQTRRRCITRPCPTTRHGLTSRRRTWKPLAQPRPCRSSRSSASLRGRGSRRSTGAKATMISP